MKKITIYIINSPFIETLVDTRDLEGFSENAHDGYGIEYDKREFDTQEELSAFLSGFFYGCDDRTPNGKVVLRSDMEDDLPYIEILKSC